jgi:hypothetical protein
MYFLRSYAKNFPVRLACAPIVSKHEDVGEARQKRDRLTGRNPNRVYAVTDDLGHSCDTYPRES